MTTQLHTEALNKLSKIIHDKVFSIDELLIFREIQEFKRAIISCLDDYNISEFYENYLITTVENAAEEYYISFAFNLDLNTYICYSNKEENPECRLRINWGNLQLSAHSIKLILETSL